MGRSVTFELGWGAFEHWQLAIEHFDAAEDARVRKCGRCMDGSICEGLAQEVVID